MKPFIDMRIFTPEEATACKAKVKSGAPLDAIAREMRCSRHVLRREMRRLRIKPLRKPKPRLTPEETAAILQAAANGEPCHWIAETLKRSRSAVKSVARARGTPFIDPRRLRHINEGRVYVTDSDPFDVDAGKYAAFLEAGKQELARVRA